jgi:hypothetical protein
MVGVLMHEPEIFACSDPKLSDAQTRNQDTIKHSNTVKGTVWGERTWQKGEVEGTPALDAAFEAGRSVR